MRWPNLIMLMMALAAGTEALAQMPTYNLGRTPSKEEIRAWGIIVSPAGEELPPGSGNAKQGAAIYAQKCAHCHGQTGTEGPFRVLVGDKRRSKHPFATTLWDYINRAMPRQFPQIGFREESLSADEVYALTAFLLYRNGIIQESDVLDAKSLPKIRMPTRDPHTDWLAQPADDSKD